MDYVKLLSEPLWPLNYVKSQFATKPASKSSSWRSWLCEIAVQVFLACELREIAIRHPNSLEVVLMEGHGACEIAVQAFMAFELHEMPFATSNPWIT